MEPGERAVFRVRQHWARLAVLVGPLTAVVVVYAAGVVSDEVVPRGVESAVVALAAVVALLLYGRWFSLRVVMTDQRFIRASGLLRRRIRTWPITVAGGRIRYARGPVGWLLGYGTISFYPVGRPAALQLRFMPRPGLLYLVIINVSIEVLAGKEVSASRLVGEGSDS